MVRHFSPKINIKLSLILRIKLVVRLVIKYLYSKEGKAHIMQIMYSNKRIVKNLKNSGCFFSVSYQINSVLLFSTDSVEPLIFSPVKLWFPYPLLREANSNGYDMMQWCHTQTTTIRRSACFLWSPQNILLLPFTSIELGFPDNRRASRVNVIRAR